MWISDWLLMWNLHFHMWIDQYFFGFFHTYIKDKLWHMNSYQQQPEQTRTDRNLGHSSFSSDGLDLPRLGLVLVYSVCSWLTRGRVMAAFGSVLANSSGPPQCHHPTCYVGWMRVSGTIWLSGIRSDMICFSFRCGLEFQYGETFTQFIIFLFCHNS